MPPLPSPLLSVLLVVACAAALFALRALWRWRAVPAGSWLSCDWTGPISELSPRVPRWRRWLGRRPHPSVAELRSVFETAAHDPALSGVLIRLGELELGWATAQSARDEVQRLRAAGKRVVAFLPFGAGNKELLIASACDEVYATPPATFGPLGVSLGSHFFKTALDRLGLEVEVLARREFKSAAESFVRDGFSEPNRAQSEAVADALHGALVRALIDGRAMTEASAHQFINDTPMRARQALERGAIDGALYEDELLARLGDRSGPLPAAKLVGFDRYARARRPRARGSRWSKRVAVVDVRGAITTSAPDVSDDRVADVPRVARALRAAAESRSVGAVVLFIDSPGGSALASDLIAREVDGLRARKPVVAYLSNVAASGGYYVAALCDRIIAQPTAITGSIGVIALRVLLSRAAEKIGVRHEQVDRGARAGLYSPYRAWSEEDRAVIDRSMDEVYDDFVSIVARGRGRTKDEVERLARGRIYAATDALAVGLVDELGNLALAIQRAAERAGIDPSLEPLRLHPHGRRPTPPMSPMQRTPPELSPTRAIAETLLGQHAWWMTFARICERERVLLLDERLAGAWT